MPPAPSAREKQQAAAAAILSLQSRPPESPTPPPPILHTSFAAVPPRAAPSPPPVPGVVPAARLRSVRPSWPQSRRRARAACPAAAGIRRTRSRARPRRRRRPRPARRRGGATAIRSSNVPCSWQFPRQRAQRALQRIARRGGSDPQNPADLAIAKTFAAQRDTVALQLRQSQDGGLQPPPAFFLDHQLLRPRRLVRPRVAVVRVNFQRPVETSMAALALVAQQVARHPKNPCPQIFLRASRLQMRVQTKEGFLDRVVGFFGARTLPSQVAEERGASFVEQAHHHHRRVGGIGERPAQHARETCVWCQNTFLASLLIVHHYAGPGEVTTGGRNFPAGKAGLGSGVPKKSARRSFDTVVRCR